jgi:mRNA interferase MazF
MRPGEIYLARFPFGDIARMKLRPVLLLTGSVGPVPEVLVAYISSVVPEHQLPSDLIVDPARPEFQGTHLKVVSAVRLHKLATLHCTGLVRFLGRLEVQHGTVIASKLRALLAF